MIVHLADGDHFSGIGIQETLNKSSRIELSATYVSVDETLAGLAASPPEILLISDTLFSGDLLHDLSQINSVDTQTKTIFLANQLEELEISQIFNAGCSGFIAKRSIGKIDFYSTLWAILNGYTLFAKPSNSDTFPSRSPLMLESSNFIRTMDERDRQIIVLVASGLRNSEIATFLHVSQTTVKQRLSFLLELFGVTNRVQLAVVATEAGLVASVSS